MELLAQLFAENGETLHPYLRTRVAGFVLEYGDWLDEATRSDVARAANAADASELGSLR